MKVADAMTSEVEVVRPEASLKEVASILAEQRISGLPVVDDGGDVLGVISGGKHPHVRERESFASWFDPVKKSAVARPSAVAASSATSRRA
jgi:predicted transcriptional regulator